MGTRVHKAKLRNVYTFARVMAADHKSKLYAFSRSLKLLVRLRPEYGGERTEEVYNVVVP